MDFTLFYRGDRLQTSMFNWKGEKLPNDSEIGPRSKVKFIAAWFSLTQGTFGLILKPKLMQIMFKEEENVFDNCLLDVNENEEENEEVEATICLNPDLGYDEDEDEDEDEHNL